MTTSAIARELRVVTASSSGEHGDAARDVARTAGRGGLAVAFAKAYFILTGLAQQIALPRILGLDGYGALGTALSFASITYNPIIGSSIHGVSRAVAQSPPETESAVLRRTLLLHGSVTAFVALLFFALAPAAGALVGAPHVVGALRILSGVILVYGVYTPLVGALNGRRKFVHQAGLDIAAATLRSIGLIAGAYLFARSGSSRLAGVEGATWGFLLGVGVVLVGAIGIVGVGRRGPGGPSVRSHLAFLAPLLASQTLLNFLFQADSLLLRTFASEAAARAGLAPTAADPFVGAYRATQLFSFLPYQLLIAVTFVLFPMLAAAKSDDRATIRSYVATGLRLALVLAGVMVSVSSGLAGPLLRLVFGEEAERHGTRSLELLSLGFGLFAVFGILTAVLNGLRRELASAAVTALAFALVVGACLLWVRGAPLSDELLYRTASATSAGIALATLGAAWLVARTAGGLVGGGVVLRVVLATSLAVMLGRVLPRAHVLAVIPFSLLVVVTYVAALLVTRELGARDLALVRRVLKRSARESPRA